MSNPLSITVSSFADTPMLRLSGSLVFAQDLQAARDAVTVLATAGHRRLVLDMTSIDATDSSGISVLLDVRHLIGDERGQVVLVRPSERLRSVLAVIRVTTLFGVVDDETELAHLLAG